MLFNTGVFALFLVVVLAAFHALRTSRARTILLLVCGLGFYATFGARFVALLLVTPLLDFYVARQIAKTDDERRRKLLVFASVAANLGVLGYFKYTNFFLESGGDLLAWLGRPISVPVLDIALPVGISFFTFQSISYVVDVYRGVLEPADSVIEFLAGITFFPHLLAGPLVRSSQLLHQLKDLRPPSWAVVQSGYVLIAVGLAKKTIADLLSPLVDMAIMGVPHVPPPTVGPGVFRGWTVAIGFAGEIYGDFSGYTDMAIGIALLFGIRLPLNFNLPYLAWSPIEFWRRWHISLSLWLQDYLYMPLALRFRARPYMCLFATWILAGLWHGARWTFVAYGAFHGLLLVLTYIVGRWAPPHLSGPTDRRWLRLGKTLLTFYLVLIGFTLFRADDFSKAAELIGAMHGFGQPNIGTYDEVALLMLAVLGVVSCHLLDYLVRRANVDRRPIATWATLAAAILFCILFGNAGMSFIYFDF